MGLEKYTFIFIIILSIIGGIYAGVIILPPPSIAVATQPKPLCMDGADYVRTPTGRKRINELMVGDQVAVGKTQNCRYYIYEPILTFLHRDQSKNADGLRFITSNNFGLSLSEEHLIFLAPQKKAVLAKNVKVGDFLYLTRKIEMRPKIESQYEEVIKIEKKILDGRYSPLTKSGVILVNDILVSCYSQVEDHEMMHYVVQYLLPFTKSDLIFGSENSLVGSDGIHVIGNSLWRFFRHYFMFNSN